MRISDALKSIDASASDRSEKVLAVWQALNDAAAFRAPYSQPPSDAAVSRLLSQSTWAADDDFAFWPVAANFLNWSYRLMQLREGNDRSGSMTFRDSVCALPVVGELDERAFFALGGRV